MAIARVLESDNLGIAEPFTLVVGGASNVAKVCSEKKMLKNYRKPGFQDLVIGSHEAYPEAYLCSHLGADKVFFSGRTRRTKEQLTRWLKRNVDVFASDAVMASGKDNAPTIRINTATDAGKALLAQVKTACARSIKGGDLRSTARDYINPREKDERTTDERRADKAVDLVEWLEVNFSKLSTVDKSAVKKRLNALLK